MFFFCIAEECIAFEESNEASTSAYNPSDVLLPHIKQFHYQPQQLEPLLATVCSCQGKEIFQFQFR